MIKDLQVIWKKYEDKQYAEFIISGEPLKNYLGFPTSKSVTPIGFFEDKELEKIALNQFRLKQKTRLIDGRVELYICAACGDIGCGSVTVKIIDRGDKIIWTEFGEQSSEDEIDEFINVEEIVFERKNYFNAFARIK
jgi:hypothetical protein